MQSVDGDVERLQRNILEVETLAERYRDAHLQAARLEAQMKSTAEAQAALDKQESDKACIMRPGGFMLKLPLDQAQDLLARDSHRASKAHEAAVQQQQEILEQLKARRQATEISS